MVKRSALALCSIAIFTAVSSHTVLAYTDEEIGKAKQFIEEKFSPEKKALLHELAKKAGKSPEELFLDISKIGGENFLGENPDDPDESDNEPPSGIRKSAPNPKGEPWPDPGESD